MYTLYRFLRTGWKSAIKCNIEILPNNFPYFFFLFGSNVELESRLRLTRSHDSLFGLRVGRQLSCVYHHRPAHGGDGASPQGEETLLSNDPEEGVEDILVVPPLVGGQVTVRGHSNQSDLNKTKKTDIIVIVRSTS